MAQRFGKCVKQANAILRSTFSRTQAIHSALEGVNASCREYTFGVKQSANILFREHRVTLVLGPVVVVLFILSAVGANVCFSFVYALEFLFGSDAPDSRWLRFWRPLFMVLGTLFAMLLALFGSRNIAFLEYSFR